MSGRDIGRPRSNGRAVMSAAACVLFLAFLAGCAPSREFLLKKSTEIGAHKSYVRVLLLNTAKRVAVASPARMKISGLSDRRTHYDGKGRSVFFYPEKVKEPVVVESWDSPLSVNGAPFRGAIELHSRMGRLLVINVLTMDEYLSGVVPCEISSGWNVEALRAQAVAARSYAYYHIMNGTDTLFDLNATNRSQVYGGAGMETERTNKAVRDTSGQVASLDNKPILAFFHSTCGGSTIDGDKVWKGAGREYLRKVRCEYCAQSPHFVWEEMLTLYEIRLHLAKKYVGVGQVTGIAFRKEGGRVSHVTVDHKNGVVRLSGNDFRLLFPEKKIKSLLFEAVKTKNGLLLKGHGWGHGVGLCQWGANGMAERKAAYADILRHYYRGTRLMIMAEKTRPGSGNNLAQNKQRRY
ncbi:MAG TPA: SpoIID/LytB domain-containing protein [Spirochaetota bacterium]|nr:SpoIID/LytB domain-containing protein [Spirochaetota bacterium]